MTRGWMYGLSRTDLRYLTSINTFITAVVVDAGSGQAIFCPCKDCINIRKFVNVEQIQCHLIIRGFMKDYTIWSKHGVGGVNVPQQTTQQTFNDVIMTEEDTCVNTQTVPTNDFFRNTLADDTEHNDDDMSQLLHDVESEFLSARQLKKLEIMRKNAKTPLYKSCLVSKLEAGIMLLEFKSTNGLNNKGFDNLLGVVRELLPEPNELLERAYLAKQMICPIGLEVEKIHACSNDCILYCGEEYKDLDMCPKCKAPRYKHIRHSLPRRTYAKKGLITTLMKLPATMENGVLNHHDLNYLFGHLNEGSYSNCDSTVTASMDPQRRAPDGSPPNYGLHLYSGWSLNSLLATNEQPVYTDTSST